MTIELTIKKRYFNPNMSTSYNTQEREKPITTVTMTRRDRVSRKAVEEYHQRKQSLHGIERVKS
jgi:hypothetical protein